jgi:hypothetical protein
VAEYSALTGQSSQYYQYAPGSEGIHYPVISDLSDCAIQLIERAKLERTTIIVPQ